MTWELLWKTFFVGVLALFSGMSVLVTVLGARDIRRLLRGLRDEKDRGGEENPPDGDA